MLEWVVKKCSSNNNTNTSQLPMLVKVDDDVFLNAPIIRNMFQTYRSRDWVAGHRAYCKPVIRRHTFHGGFMKWAVAESLYPNSYYPDYINGFWFVSFFPK